MLHLVSRDSIIEEVLEEVNMTEVSLVDSTEDSEVVADVEVAEVGGDEAEVRITSVELVQIWDLEAEEVPGVVEVDSEAKVRDSSRAEFSNDIFFPRKSYLEYKF